MSQECSWSVALVSQECSSNVALVLQEYSSNVRSWSVTRV